MAKCPECNINWFWDWEQDCYRYSNGSEVEIILLTQDKNGDSEIHIFKCKCGAINSAMAENSLGAIMHCTEKWQSVSWENDGHSWDNKCFNCKDQKCLNEDTK